MIYDLSFIPLRNIYYRIIKANRYPLYLKHQMDKKICNMHNIHKGESCFIIGNGPSLNISDLEQISKLEIKTFATNSIYKIFNETNWRPVYYCAQDQQVIDKIGADFDFVIKDCKGMFVRRDVYNQLSKEVQQNEKLYLPRLVMHIRKDRYFDFSEDLSKCGFDGCTITYLMMQIAYYMGFKTIYLIGIDHNFPFLLDENENIILDDSLKQDFFEREEKNRINPARPYEMTMAYKSAKKFFDANGVKIFNATRGGKLEVFERINLDQILEGDG
ncbi:MAG: DUF115 domain-containing protein [Hungatella sp.]|nr:DUF115 domain-containing protein [Hungatella sp.]